MKNTSTNSKSPTPPPLRKANIIGKFTNDNFSKEVNKRIRANLNHRSKLKGPSLYLLYYLSLFILFFVSLYFFSSHQDNFFLFTVGIFHSILLSVIALSASHIFMHRCVFLNSNLNKFLGWIFMDVFFGVSSFYWHVYHNEKHHMFCQMKAEGTYFDPDHKIIAKIKKIKTKKIRILFLFLALSTNFLAQTYWFDLQRFFKGIKNIHANKIQQFYFILGKLLHISIVWLPLILVHGEEKGSFLYLFIYLLSSLMSGLCFLISHTNDYVKDVEINNKVHNSWTEAQIRATVNYSMNCPLITLLHGGLNYQIEHHVFPDIHPHFYPRISRELQKICQDYNIPYNAFKTTREGVWSSLKHIYNS